MRVGKMHLIGATLDTGKQVNTASARRCIREYLSVYRFANSLLCVSDSFFYEFLVIKKSRK